MKDTLSLDIILFKKSYLILAGFPSLKALNSHLRNSLNPFKFSLKILPLNFSSLKNNMALK